MDRTLDPAETWERVQPLLQSFGITRLSRLTGLDRLGIPVWQAVSPNSRSIVINQGKGVSDLDARVSAAMEALERAIACEPSAGILRASPLQMSAMGRRHHTLPQLIAVNRPDIADDEMVTWIEGRDLVAKDAIWAPWEATSLDRTVHECRFWQSSDGLASGNSETEAILHGLLERVERDAAVLWGLRPVADRLRTCIDPARLQDPVIDALMERYNRAGLAIRVFDLTSDIDVPCYAAFVAEADILKSREPRFHEVTAGYGAHLACERAVVRALTEAAQSRLTYISGARDDVFRQTYERALPQEIQALFEAIPGKPRRRPVPTTACSPGALLTMLLEKLVASGIRSVISVSLQRGNLPVSVVKIFVPDLENPEGHRKRRFGARALSFVISAE